MPNPKHKHSKARRDRRRTAEVEIRPRSLSVCPQCHLPKLPHYTGLYCGTYKGQEVIAVRGEPDSSVCVGTDRVKKDEAVASSSTGNAAATVVTASVLLRILRGVARPAIPALLPTLTRHPKRLDVGPPVHSTPSQPPQFA